jgi:hypothetical protein
LAKRSHGTVQNAEESDAFRDFKHGSQIPPAQIGNIGTIVIIGPDSVCGSVSQNVLFETPIVWHGGAEEATHSRIK